jgi:hypothetical protein
VIKDPLTAWDDGPYPYDELSETGVTPESSQAQIVDDAPFELMISGTMNPRAQKALDELGDPQRRLVADFLLYDVDLAEEIARARERLARAPAEPPEVTEALVMSLEVIKEQASELASADPASSPDTPGAAGNSHAPGAPDVPERPDSAAFPAQSLIDDLIQFDR